MKRRALAVRLLLVWICHAGFWLAPGVSGQTMAGAGTKALLAGWDFNNISSSSVGAVNPRYSDVWGDVSASPFNAHAGAVFFNGTGGSDNWPTVARVSTGADIDRSIDGRLTSAGLGSLSGAEGMLSLTTFAAGTNDKFSILVHTLDAANTFENLSLSLFGRDSGNTSGGVTIHWSYSLDGGATKVPTALSSTFKGTSFDRSHLDLSAYRALRGVSDVFLIGTVVESASAANLQLDNIALYGVAVQKRPSDTGSRGRLGNLSVRAFAGVGAQTLSLGFVIAGTPHKPVLVRAIGPTLANFAIVDAALDPRLRLVQGAVAFSTNDDWASPEDGGPRAVADLAAAFASIGAFPLNPASKDAALVSPLAAGAFTAEIELNGAPGLVLAELYDTAPQSGARLVNVSARAQVGQGEQGLVAGFVISSDASVRVLIRAVGPGLEQFGVGGVLADPQLDLFRGAVRIERNDDWASGAAGQPSREVLADVFAQVGAFGLAGAGSRDSALLVALEPGTYSAQITGVGGALGVALVEIYEVP
jgi:hypothetical protein